MSACATQPKDLARVLLSRQRPSKTGYLAGPQPPVTSTLVEQPKVKLGICSRIAPDQRFELFEYIGQVS